MAMEFKSFWMAGFECADQLNCHGNRVDLVTATKHLENIDEDYRALRQFDIKSVREGIRWSKVELQPNCYDFSEVKLMIDAADAYGIQQIWDICHFGFPDDLSPLHPHFERRFVAVCCAFVEFYRSYKPNDMLIITPINEVGFISWLGGEVGSTVPYAKNMGWDVKYCLTRAYISAIEEVKKIDPTIKILTTEPLVNIVPPSEATVDEILSAYEQHEIQYQVIDMLTGKMCPELGGKPDNIDIMGFNFYYNNQWIMNTGQFLPWLNEEPDPRWRGLSSLLIEAYDRYNIPIILAETSHPGEDRPLWIKYITLECKKALNASVDFKGICIYPIIDRPDWDNLQDWHHAGLWDAYPDEPGARYLYQPYAVALLDCQLTLNTPKVILPFVF